MAHVFRDAVREVATANGGLASFPLAGIRGGPSFRTFAEAAIADGDTFDYVAEGAGAREWGVALYAAGSLARSPAGSVAGGVASAGGYAFPAGVAVTIGIVLTAARATALVGDPILTALAGLDSAPGVLAQTGAAAFAKRTLAGTANEIAVANGDGQAGAPVISLPSALALTGKNVTGGSFAALQAWGIRSSGAGAFDLSFANTENLTAGRTLTLKLNDANRTIELAGNLTLAGAYSLTLTQTAATSVTLPAAGTLLATPGGQNLTGGFTATSFNAGTKSSGTFAPDPASGNIQHYVNGGAHTLAPPSQPCTMIIECTNSSAGTLTTSGFSIVSGDTYSSAGTKKHIFYVTRTNSFSQLHIQYVTGT